LGGIHHPFLDPTNGKNEWPSESDEPKYHFLVLIELKKKTASSEKRVNKKSSRKPHLKINARIHRAPLARSLVSSSRNKPPFISQPPTHRQTSLIDHHPQPLAPTRIKHNFQLLRKKNSFFSSCNSSSFTMRLIGFSPWKHTTTSIPHSQKDDGVVYSIIGKPSSNSSSSKRARSSYNQDKKNGKSIIDEQQIWY